jgi:small conductance mechanosensitive channel
MLTYINNYGLNSIFNPATILGAIFYAVIIIALSFILRNLLQLAVNRYLNKVKTADMDPTAARFLGQLVTVLVFVIALIFYTRLIPALQTLGTAWLASVGVISVIIGLATQGTLSNLVAGISLILYRPFRIGDRIQVTTPAGPEIGVVESIDLGYTSLCTPDGSRILLPNSLITNQTHINFSRNFSRVLLEITVTAASGNDIEPMRKILTSTAKTVEKITKVNGCFITSLSGQGTAMILSVMCLDPGDIAQIKSNVLEKAKKEFDAAGIKLA